VSDDLIRALLIGFGVVSIAFGVVYGWLTSRLRGEHPSVVTWGIANAAFYVALGALVVLAALLPGAVNYAIVALGLTLVGRFVARRQLLKGGGGLR
jgi:MFS-type transporter involved in bile tolerance (Atg22 family)